MEREKSMEHGIGVAAGKVWAYLNQNGEASPNKIARGTGMSGDLVQRAIGWLAREEKLHSEKSSRGERIRLR